MAVTRYRLPSSGTAGATPAFQSYTHNNSVRRPLPTSDSTALATQAYTPDAADHGSAGDALHVQFVSDALPTGTVYSTNNVIKGQIQGLEAHSGNNQNIQVWVGVYSNDGSTLRQTLRGKVAPSSELGTTLANRFFVTTVLNAYTTVAGDRLVVEISVQGTPGGGGGVQGHNASLRWGSDGAGGDLPEDNTETGTTFNPWFEIEDTQLTPTRLRVSQASLEVPNVPTRLRVSQASLEVPNVPTRLRVSQASFEVPGTPTRLRVSQASLEVPDIATPTRLLVSQASVEVPNVPTRLRVSHAYLEVPLVPTRLRVSQASLEVPTVPTRGRVSHAYFEVPAVGTRLRVSQAYLEVPEVGAAAQARRKSIAPPPWIIYRP